MLMIKSRPVILLNKGTHIQKQLIENPTNVLTKYYLG